MQGQKSRSWRFKIETSQLRETTLTENIGPPGEPGVGRGAGNPTLEKTLVTKSEEAIAGYFSWQNLLRKAKAHVGLSSQWWWWWWWWCANCWNPSRMSSLDGPISSLSRYEALCGQLEDRKNMIMLLRDQVVKIYWERNWRRIWFRGALFLALLNFRFLVPEKSFVL
jgi:hypothetical protein